jgi:metal-sulfur cluster biosynthetic enzyme
MLTEQQVIEALKPIQDPELHLGIVDLGLIYEVKASPASEGQGEQVVLRMTFTTPFCPYGPMLKNQVHQALQKLPGVTQARVDVVFTPPWDPRTMASEEAKITLGLGWGEEDEAGPGHEIENQR